MEVKCKSDLDAWLAEAESHAMSDLGFYIRFAKKAGLENIGRGHGNFISFGSLELPENTEVKGFNNNSQFLSAGFSQGCKNEKFNHKKIKEDVSYSWFQDYANAKHPFDGVTNPYATGKESGKYSWAKAPRYDGMAAETGPLAEMVCGSDPFFMDIIKSDGPNVFNRELARLVRTARLIPTMEKWLAETARCKEAFYRDYEKIENGEGFGLIEAPRGSLGHWVKIQDAKIEKYQIITPTAWNASPRDSNGIRGPWEEAIVGTEIKDKDNPIEVGHIVRSFDACLVCAVHTIKKQVRI